MESIAACAAVSDYAQAAMDSIRGYEPQGTGKVWIDVYERGAVQPVEEVDKVNIPILLIHGSVDSRVLPKQAKLYRNALDKAGIQTMGLNCTIASITGVVPAGQIDDAVEAIQGCFEVPSIIRK